MCVCVCAFCVNNHSSDVAGFGHYNLSKIKCYYWQLGIHRCLGKSDCWRWQFNHQSWLSHQLDVFPCTWAWRYYDMLITVQRNSKPIFIQYIYIYIQYIYIYIYPIYIYIYIYPIYKYRIQSYYSYPLVILHSYGKSPFSIGKSTINCHFQ